MNMPDYLSLSILDLSKTVLLYEFWYDYVKPKYGKQAKICYMDPDIFTVYLETSDNYKDTPEDFEKRFYTSNFE